MWQKTLVKTGNIEKMWGNGDVTATSSCGDAHFAYAVTNKIAFYPCGYWVY
jgi:hypothetical protein